MTCPRKIKELQKVNYVYVLKSLKDGGLYIGFTTNLEERLKRHKAGGALSTRNRIPIILIYYECFNNRQDAVAREKYLKSGYGREQLKQILKNTFKKLNTK